MVAELNSTPEPFSSIAMCVIAATTTCMSFGLAKRLKRGKVIIMKQWARHKGHIGAATSEWMLLIGNIYAAVESG
ncbi:hypothetical protein [Streptomyces sp. NPDC056165]|uniref:hypothetical protein n=1 Tax=Streptomyces sp. NPDC056165 TaxID=3345733 RepID=UPI0035D752F9